MIQIVRRQKVDEIFSVLPLHYATLSGRPGFEPRLPSLQDVIPSRHSSLGGAVGSRTQPNRICNPITPPGASAPSWRGLMDLNHREQSFTDCCLFARPSPLNLNPSSVVKDRTSTSWSVWRGSNPRPQLGKLMHYHCATNASYFSSGASGGARTRGLDLGKVALYH